MSETKGAAYQKLHDVTQHVFMISKVRSAFNKAPVRVTLDTSGQHTLKWAGIEMRLADSTHVKLPPGECNLYLFPAAVLEGRPATLVGKNLEAMSELLLALATDPSTADMMLTPDAVGAYPIHALLVANTEQSCKLSMRLFHAEPGLMIQPHATGPFIGENCLHVVAANSHESELVEMLELAISRLPRDMVEHMLTAQTEGVFFNESPMRFYGGTPLGYACCFCLKRAVAAMLTTELVSLNAPAARCDITGFLPIHAVCANGLKDMYNWLTTGVGKPGEPTLAPAQLATAGLAVAEGRLTALKLSHCTPIQLAAQLGDKSMFLFLLRKQTNILWKWGPVTQYEIDLQGVDSAGDAECDVMEVIGRLDCHEETTEMLLDTFMQGFIHKLFEQKWWRYGQPLHYAKIVVHLTYLVLLAHIGFVLKEDPAAAAEYTVVPLVLLLLLVGLVCSETRTFHLWWQNEGDSHGTKQKAWMGAMWLASFQVDFLLLGYAFATTAVVLLLVDNGGLDGLTARLSARLGSGADEASAGRRALHDGYLGDLGDLMSPSFDQDAHDAAVAQVAGSWAAQGNHSLVLLLLGLGLFSKSSWLMYNALTPFQSLGVFMLSVNRMLRNDIFIFMVLFVLFIVNFYFMLYMVYPRAGDLMLPEAAQFNHWGDALQAMATLAFLQEPIEIELASEQLLALSGWQRVDMVVFVCFYILYVLMSIILLLNLVIAMLSFNFNIVYDKSTLEWRLMFARYVLRMELIARSLGCWDLRVGEKKGDKYIWSFRDVTANAEGGGASGNPFENTDLLDDDEKEKEERQRDLLTNQLLAKVDAALGTGVLSGDSRRRSSDALDAEAPRPLRMPSTIRSETLEDLRPPPPPARGGSALYAVDDLDAKLQAMHDAHATELAKLQAQMGDLMEMVGKLAPQ